MVFRVKENNTKTVLFLAERVVISLHVLSSHFSSVTSSFRLLVLDDAPVTE